jgi:hypothetical protein
VRRGFFVTVYASIQQIMWRAFFWNVASNDVANPLAPGSTHRRVDQEDRRSEGLTSVAHVCAQVGLRKPRRASRGELHRRGRCYEPLTLGFNCRMDRRSALPVHAVRGGGSRADHFAPEPRYRQS